VAMQMLSVELWLKLARRRNGLKGSVCSTNFQTPLHPLGSFVTEHGAIVSWSFTSM